MGSSLTRSIPVIVLLSIIEIIVSFESFVLIRSSRKKVENHIQQQQKMSKEFSKNEGIVTAGNNNNSTNDRYRSVPTINTKRIALESAIGFGVGFLGGLVGLILGSIRMPAMISMLKMEPRIAVGTNLAASSIMGISGLTGHITNNNIDYTILMVMGATAMIGGYIGAKYTNRFSERNLKFMIGIVLIVVAITMFLRIIILV
jgi:uncharacterized protein